VMTSESDRKLGVSGAAAEVLWVVGGYDLDRGPLAREPGSFHRVLIEAMLKADRRNLSVLMEGFPNLGSMVATYKNHGVEMLERYAESRKGDQ